MVKNPIKISEKKKKDLLGIAVYAPVFRWQDKEFIDLDTQEKATHKIWRFVSQNRLNSVFTKGRKTFNEIEKYKVRTVTGEVVERERRTVKGRVYAYEALAQALTETRGVPITAHEVESMIQQAKDANFSSVSFVLESDLYPTDPESWEGENRWRVIAEVPDSDLMNAKINANLKASGSTLRLPKSIKTKIVEA